MSKSQKSVLDIQEQANALIQATHSHSWCLQLPAGALSEWTWEQRMDEIRWATRLLTMTRDQQVQEVDRMIKEAWDVLKEDFTEFEAY